MALSSLQERLKNHVQLQHGLGDKLERAAGGFMDKGEAIRVRDKQLLGNSSQMGEVITILRGKRDEDFEIFCKILQESNNNTWADEVKKEAEQFKSAIGQYESSNVYSISSMNIHDEAIHQRKQLCVSCFAPSCNKLVNALTAM